MKEFINKKLQKFFAEDIFPQKEERIQYQEEKEILLTFSLMFNDLKDIILLNDLFVESCKKPEEKEISVHAGEYGGIRLHILRLYIGTLYEVCNYMTKKISMIESSYIQSFIQKTNEDTQSTWKHILLILQKNTRKKNFSDIPQEVLWVRDLVEIIRDVRNNTSFHYQTNKRLVEGYRKFFFQDNLSDEKRYAYRSINHSKVLESRHYYADAAIQGYLEKYFGKDDSVDIQLKRCLRLSSKMMQAINNVLEQYHKTIRQQ
ncbi:MAG: hypothetical protein IPN70_01740 [Candidatus Moraniibacteriota bacterium]|nr:MAG: hypothetical protein IPN70_01740 [Candidatus Moranbacteria bacterium]